MLYFQFKNKPSNNNDDLYAFYRSQKQKDSVRLLTIMHKINKYKERREIDSILEEVRISDSLVFENMETAKVFFKSKDIENKVISTKKTLNKQQSDYKNKRSFSDYNRITNNSEETKVNSNFKKEKYHISTDKFAVFKGCERKNNEVKRRKCLNSKLKRHISKNINKKIFREKGIKRVDVLVAITKEGYLKILKIKTALSELYAKEIIRVLESCPRFIAAIENQQKVGVKFNLPIHF